MKTLYLCNEKLFFMITINQALDAIMELDFYSREMLLEIFEKRQIEERRKEILRNVKTAKSAYKKGILKPLSASETISILSSLR
jgi:hypothetical protein